MGDENLLWQGRETSPEPSPRVAALRVPVLFDSESLPALIALVDGIEIVADYDTLLSFARVLIDLERLDSSLVASEDKPRTGFEIIERIEEFATRSTDWGKSYSLAVNLSRFRLSFCGNRNRIEQTSKERSPVVVVSTVPPESRTAYFTFLK